MYRKSYDDRWEVMVFNKDLLTYTIRNKDYVLAPNEIAVSDVGIGDGDEPEINEICQFHRRFIREKNINGCCV